MFHRCVKRFFILLSGLFVLVSVNAGNSLLDVDFSANLKKIKHTGRNDGGFSGMLPREVVPNFSWNASRVRGKTGRENGRNFYV